MRVIINADDFGMSKSINEAIINLCEVGSISSTTVMSNMPFINEVSELLNFEEISIGLHINLTQGSPISQISEIETIVDSSGEFYTKSILLEKIQNNEIEYEHIKREVWAQYHKLKNLIGDKLTHFDSHQGSTRIKMVYKALLDLQVKDNINSAIRVHSKYYFKNEKDSVIIMKPNITNIFHFGLKRVFVEYYLRNKRNRWRNEFKTPDGMLFTNDNSVLNTLMFIELFADRITDNGIYEISCHPSTKTSDLNNTSMTDIRVQEYNLLMKHSFLSALQNFDLISYRSLIANN